MEGVKEAAAAFEPKFKQWLDGEAVPMFETAKTLGIPIPAGFQRTIGSGHTTVASSPATPARPRARRRTTRTTRSNGGGGTVTGSQLVAYLQEHGPANQSQLATQFGTTRQTIANRLKGLGPQVVRDGQQWKARELTAA